MPATGKLSRVPVAAALLGAHGEHAVDEGERTSVRIGHQRARGRLAGLAGGPEVARSTEARGRQLPITGQTERG